MYCRTREDRRLAKIIFAILLLTPLVTTSLAQTTVTVREETVREDAVREDAEAVGRRGEGRTVLPINQVITPLGKQVDLPDLRPQALALSPDGKWLAVSGRTSEVLIINPATGEIAQRAAIRAGAKVSAATDSSVDILETPVKGQVSYGGLVYSPDGGRLFLGSADGDLKIFVVAADGTLAMSDSVALPPALAPQRDAEIPAGIACSADGTRLYVCGNLSNRLLEFDANKYQLLRSFDVGVAPFAVVVLHNKAYVSNWGGRRPAAGDLTGPAGRGTRVRVDSERHVACEGSVTVVDLNSGQRRDIVTGLHASALAASPDGSYVVCANAASDNLSVIATQRDEIVETIWVKPKPSDLFGASPNALAFSPDSRTLYVANGTQNAVAIVQFEPQEKESKLVGLLPVGWFPGALVWDTERHQLCVANIKGHPDQPAPTKRNVAPPETVGFNTHQYFGSLSLVPLPSPDELPVLSQRVWDNLHRERIEKALLPPRAGQPARAIPQRIGEPSLIKHVVYVIKENRTYDQVLGDFAGANGDARLCIFGERVTPNQHKLAREFVTLDNTYCAGILSADGHQWSTTAFSTDYVEKSFPAWTRSYPTGGSDASADALAYSPAGFIWDNALRHQISLRNYGEFMATRVRWQDSQQKRKLSFRAGFEAWQNGTHDVIFESEPTIETIRPFSPIQAVGWDLVVPDQYRADFFLRELRAFEAAGEFPQLVIVYLPNDHTHGTARNFPTPAAMVADNDLAFGRIVEGLSQSRFWKETAIFAIEDDPQNGWDHVSGYRTTAYIASPYARRQCVISTQYNTTSVLRTIEQILGLPPMNQFDASATPMWDCFGDTPDCAPFTALPATVALDQMNPDPRKVSSTELRADALACEQMDFVHVDRAPEDELNRVLWRAMRGTTQPYPSWAVAAVDDDDDEPHGE